MSPACAEATVLSSQSRDQACGFRTGKISTNYLYSGTRNDNDNPAVAGVMTVNIDDSHNDYRAV